MQWNRVVEVEFVGVDGGDAKCETPGPWNGVYRIDISISTVAGWHGVQTIASGEFPEGVHVEGSFTTICTQDSFGPSPGQSVKVRVRIDHFDSGVQIVPRSATSIGLTGIVADPFPAESVDLEPLTRLAASFDSQCDGPSPGDAFPFGFALPQIYDGLGVAPIDTFGCWNVWATTPRAFSGVEEVRDFFAFDESFIVKNLALVTDVEGSPAVIKVGPSARGVDACFQRRSTALLIPLRGVIDRRRLYPERAVQCDIRGTRFLQG